MSDYEVHDLMGDAAAADARLETRLEKNLSWLRQSHEAIHEAIASLPPGKTKLALKEGEAPNLLIDGAAFYPADPGVTCSRQVLGHLATLKFRSVGLKAFPDLIGQIHVRYLNQALKENPGLCGGLPLPAEIMAVPVIYVYGLGLGYHLDDLERRLDPQFMVLFEPDLEIFRAALHTCDLAGLDARLKRHGGALWPVVGAGAEQAMKSLRAFYKAYGAYLTAVRVEYWHYRTASLEATAAFIRRHEFAISASPGFFDDTLFALSHAACNFRDDRHFALKTVSLREDMRAVPVFIIGNGPSLDGDLSFLRKHQDEALVVACGSALDTLYHCGIKPDFYCCIERANVIAQTLAAIPDKDFLKSLTLIATEVVSPEVAAFFSRCLLFFKADDVTLMPALLHDIGVRDYRYLVDASPLVSNLALSSFMELGFRDLYLFGVDNGTPDRGKLHSSSSEIYKRNPRLEQTSEGYELHVELPGNFGGTVMSGPFYALCVESMEDLIRTLGKNTAVHNCSDGVQIAGAAPLRSDAVSLPPDAAAKSEVISFIQDSMSAPYHPATDIKQWLDIPDFDAAADLCARIAHALKRARNRHETLAALGRFNRLMRSLKEAYKPLAHSALSGTLLHFSNLILKALYEFPDEEKSLGAASAVADLCLCFLEDAKILYRQVPNFIMGRHGGITGGKIGFDHPGSPAPPLPAPHALYARDYKDPLPVFVKRYE